MGMKSCLHAQLSIYISILLLRQLHLVVVHHKIMFQSGIFQVLYYQLTVCYHYAVLTWNLLSLRDKLIRNFLLSTSRDVLCGKLACVQPHKNANKSEVQSTVYSYIQDHVCVSIATGSSMRSDGTDNAYVADGTMCGPEMVTKCDNLYSAVLNYVSYQIRQSMMTITIILNGFKLVLAFISHVIFK